MYRFAVSLLSIFFLLCSFSSCISGVWVFVCGTKFSFEIICDRTRQVYVIIIVVINIVTLRLFTKEIVCFFGDLLEPDEISLFFLHAFFFVDSIVARDDFPHIQTEGNRKLTIECNEAKKRRQEYLQSYKNNSKRILYN